MSAAAEAFGAYLRRLRQAKGWSLRDVDHLTRGGVTFGYLSRLEKGSTENPSVRLIGELARVYGVSFARLCRRACPGAPE